MNFERIYYTYTVCDTQITRKEEVSMQLKQDSGVPIYRQIADSFKEDILSGRIAQGEYLPSIRALAQKLDISVITTIKAYKILQEEGVITAVCGKGFYVNAQNCENLRKQHIYTVEEKMREIVRAAKLAGITEPELVEKLKSMIKREE